MPTPCNAKIVATLGPASADRATIEALDRLERPVTELRRRPSRHEDASGPLSGS